MLNPFQCSNIKFYVNKLTKRNTSNITCHIWLSRTTTDMCVGGKPKHFTVHGRVVTETLIPEGAGFVSSFNLRSKLCHQLLDNLGLGISSLSHNLYTTLEPTENTNQEGIKHKGSEWTGC